MIRRLALPTAAALVGAVLSAPPAAAEPPAGTPTVTLTGSVGGNITQLQEVTVTDLDAAALSVRLQYPGLSDQVHLVEAGVVAPFYLETWGLGGNKRDLVVVQCSDVEATPAECGEPVTISTKVTNPLPTFDFTPAGTEFAEDFDLTAHLDVASGTPRIRLIQDAGAPTYADPGAATLIDTDALVEGPHSIAIGVCSADELRCTAGITAPFDVVRSVGGSFSVAAPVFSPNGDGQLDTIDFSYTQVGSWDSASVEVRNAADEVVFSGAVPLPAPANDGTFVYDGKDTVGVVLPDGSYTATLTASRTLDSGDVVSSTFAPDAFVVDTVALAPASLTSQWPTLFPYVDGYRDTTTLGYTGLESYSRVDFVVRNAANDLVRTKQVLVPADASWDGLDDIGARVPAGSYTVLVRVIDAAGNIGFSPAVAITVSDKMLIRRTRSVNVTPKAARVDGGDIGRCSAWRVPSLHKWPGSASYLSNVKCASTYARSVVWTVQRIKLPAALKYRKVRLSWYGGPTYSWTGDTALATVYDAEGDAVQWFSSVDYLATQHLPWYPAAGIVENGKIGWGFSASDGNRYDVKKFTITYRADVLVNPA